MIEVPSEVFHNAGAVNGFFLAVTLEEADYLYSSLERQPQPPELGC